MAAVAGQGLGPREDHLGRILGTLVRHAARGPEIVAGASTWRPASVLSTLAILQNEVRTMNGLGLIAFFRPSYIA